MKEIILIRHGKPLSAHNNKLSAGEFTNWVRQYNQSPLDNAYYPDEKREFTAHHIIASPLKRAQLSANYYMGEPAIDVIPELKEMDIPYYRLPLRLRAWHWVLLNRLMWFCGKTGRFESFVEAKNRVSKAAKELEKKAEKHPQIVVFGHGMSNRYIRIFLAKRGWEITEKNNGYWGVTRLIKN
jgi:broad specificity phosphatase PhoE